MGGRFGGDLGAELLRHRLRFGLFFPVLSEFGKAL